MAELTIQRHNMEGIMVKLGTESKVITSDLLPDLINLLIDFNDFFKLVTPVIMLHKLYKADPEKYVLDLKYPENKSEELKSNVYNLGDNYALYFGHVDDLGLLDNKRTTIELKSMYEAKNGINHTITFNDEISNGKPFCDITATNRRDAELFMEMIHNDIIQPFIIELVGEEELK